MFWSLCYLAFRCVLETIALQRLYVLFFIELGSRPFHLAGCTANPTGTWVTQQARQFTWTLHLRICREIGFANPTRLVAGVKIAAGA